MMFLTFEQVLKLYIFMLIGFSLFRLKVLPQNTAAVLSKLMVNLFLPCQTFLSFANNLTVAKLTASGTMMIVSLITIVGTCVLGTLIGRRLSRDRYEQNVCVYAINIPNTSYVGAPLVLALFGSETLMQMNLFILPLFLYNYTEGFRLLLDRRNSFFKVLLTPTFMAIILGALVGLTGLPLPNVVREVCTGCSSCVGPIAMILTGSLIATFKLKDILCRAPIYYTVAIRMIVIPLIVILLGKQFGVPQDVIRIMTIVFCMPTGLNTVVFPASVGKECNLGAGMACVSNLLAVITVPIFFQLFL